MPERKTVRRASQAKRQGKSSGTQAGEFVREEMEHIKKGKHGAKSRAQAIAIGLSKARRSGVAVPPRGSRSKSGGSKKRTRIHAPRTDAKRARASEGALKRMGRPRLRGPEARASARKAANTRKQRGRKRGSSARKSR